MTNDLSSKAFLYLFATCAGFSSPINAAPEQTRPNIVYILADDLGYGDVSANNPDSKIETPNIDALASQGMRFTDAHSPTSVCTPTRYGILTGQYFWRTRPENGTTWSFGRLVIEEKRKTVAMLLKESGYATAAIGKWHLGLDWALKPGLENTLENADKQMKSGVVRDMDPKHIDFSKPVTAGPGTVGFDYSFILPASLDIPPYCYLENHELVEAPTSWTDGNDLNKGYMEAFWRPGKMAPSFDFHDVLPRFIRRAVQYIESRAKQDEPFFLYLALPAPHTPWMPTAKHKGASRAGLYGDFAQMVDAEVGKALQALSDHGLEQNTLVVLTSDNGPYWVPRDTERHDHRATAYFRGMKGDIWEGGHRIPFVARWPGMVKAGSVSQATTSLTHLMATVADILELPNPNGHGKDSYSILSVLLGQSDYVPYQPGIMMHSSKAHFAWREGDWKFIEKRGSGGFSSPVSFDIRLGEFPAQLYNLRKDPGETENLYFRYPEKVRSMQSALDRNRGR